jgi:flagellar biosynthesis/type III secretory pathway protein FliH
MVSDDLAKQLHDRATRGETLLAEEQRQLESWYAIQDIAEGKALGLATGEKTLATLQAQVDAALAQLMMVAKRIQEIASENETLRREITTLRHQLVYLLETQPG